LSSALGFPRQSFYCQNTKQNQKDELLKDQILKVMKLNPAYGHRRVALDLKINRKRARRVMNLYGLKPYKRKARWTKKKDWGQPDAGYPNLIKGVCPLKPNFFFAGDFTRLIWNQKVFYLATFMDLFTREIVGWSLSTRHTAKLVIDAYFEALKTVGKSAIVHTDQGAEYKSRDYQSFIISLGIQISMSAKASPWENGYQESFYDNFKTDLGLEFERFETIGEFVEAIHQTIRYYNQERIHTKLKTPPAEFRRQYLAQKS